ncbi:tRNA N6-adenosine threonylcarbamoyltransferase [Grifola frondosa]|uniref:tRNA N6-adenosine threonylcarbamoyltransferase n=1 Tax=Grifola frondosa TaxID=5627 RepID=A0A1C7MI61_GRIFR|nr:tRNA N6-adenosine threonylcarbamoyltransferase [Grifola frondosa]
MVTSTYISSQPGAIRKASTEANMDVNNIDGIAFTRMRGCLVVCSNAAKTLASAIGKPIVGVHHIVRLQFVFCITLISFVQHAHALTPLLTAPLDALPVFLFLTLLISGGHTLLLLANSPASFPSQHPSTRASAAPSTKCPARSTYLGPPSDQGPLSNSSAYPQKMEWTRRTLEVPRPLHRPDPPSCARTPRLLLHRPALQCHSPPTSAGVPHPVNQACSCAAKRVTSLFATSSSAARLQATRSYARVSSVHSLWCDRRLWLDAARPETRIALVFPPPALCTDNAVMIALASMDRFLSGNADDYTIDIRHNGDIEDLTKDADPSKCNYTPHLCT